MSADMKTLRDAVRAFGLMLNPPSFGPPSPGDGPQRIEPFLLAAALDELEALRAALDTEAAIHRRDAATVTAALDGLEALRAQRDELLAALEELRDSGVRRYANTWSEEGRRIAAALNRADDALLEGPKATPLQEIDAEDAHLMEGDR